MPEAVAINQSTAQVPIRSAWYSKVNWVAVVGAIGTLVTSNAIGLDAETQVKVLAVWGLAQNVATVVFRTWFNGSVSPQSLDR
jgi:hypothetical protein